MVTRLRSGSQLCTNYDTSQYVQSLYARLQFCICNLPKSQWQGPRCVLFCVLYTAWVPYCILASVLLRVHPLKFPSLPISLPPTLLPCCSDSLHCSIPPQLASSLPSFPRTVHAYVPSSLVPFLNPPFLHSRSHTSSLPHSLPLHPPSPTFPLLHPSHPPSFLAPSLPPSLPASRRPIQCTPYAYVCLASCTVLRST